MKEKLAFRYKIKIGDDDKEISEIYVPDLHCCFNKEGGFFRRNSMRVTSPHIETLQISEQDADIITRYLDYGLAVDAITKKYF